VLDLGAGTGKLTRLLAQRFARDVAAVDLGRDLVGDPRTTS
jgi:trans-aconitate methyltransferase